MLINNIFVSKMYEGMKYKFQIIILLISWLELIVS